VGWDVVTYGDLSFSAESLERWERLAVEPEHAGSLPKGFPRWQKLAVKDITMLFEWLQRRHAVHVDRRPDGLSLRALLDKDAYLDFAPQLVAAFRRASEVGGSGDLAFCGYLSAPGGIAFALDVGDSSGLAPAEETALRQSPRYREVEAIASKKA